MKWFEEMLCIMLVLLTLAICTIAFSTAVKIGNADQFSSGALGGFVAVIVALFGLLITGVFVFMTFRIDRGAIFEARSTAKREAEQLFAQANSLLTQAKKDAALAAQAAITSDKQQLLQAAKKNSEKIANTTRDETKTFALNVANKLRSATSARLTELHPRTEVKEIELLTEQDGK